MLANTRAQSLSILAVTYSSAKFARGHQPVLPGTNVENSPTAMWAYRIRKPEHRPSIALTTSCSDAYNSLSMPSARALKSIFRKRDREIQITVSHAASRIFSIKIPQPTAARACGAGVRGRRPVDPPPIVQILLSDFDSESSNDRDVLKDPQFTVGCLLLPASDSSSGLQDPEFEECQQPERNIGSDGVARADDAFFTPLLSGKTFVSPFYVDVDPDSNSAPTHPSSRDSKPENCSYSGTGNLHNESKLQQPATFFIFDDLSIRFAGIYRLEFRLMNWGSIEDKGQTIPILAEAWSDPFVVYPAR
ncbi:Velvet factor [Penicillium brevicompactum]